MTKQVQQAITPTHVLGSTGTADTSDLGYRTLANFKNDLGLGNSLTQTINNGNGTVTNPAFTFTGDPNTGIIRAAADALGFVTNGSEKVRITSAGNVGIGTSSPASPLHVVGNARVEGKTEIVASGTQRGKYIISSSFSVVRGQTTSFTFNVAGADGLSLVPLIVSFKAVAQRITQGSSGNALTMFHAIDKEFIFQVYSDGSLSTQASDTRLANVWGDADVTLAAGASGHQFIIEVDHPVAPPTSDATRAAATIEIISTYDVSLSSVVTA